MRRKRHQNKNRLAEGTLVALCLVVGALIVDRQTHLSASSLVSESSPEAPSPPLPGGTAGSLQGLILLLLLLVIVAELAWRRGDRAHEHQRAIVVLTGFIRDLEDRLHQPVEPTDIGLARRFAERYALIIEILPAHTDADYLDAKRATAKKEISKIQIARHAERQLRETEPAGNEAVA
jgi:hypothetical protein